MKILANIESRYREHRNFVIYFSTASVMLITIFTLLRPYDDVQISVLIEDNWPIFLLFFSDLVMYTSAFVSLKYSRLAGYTALFGAGIGIGYYFYLFYTGINWLTLFFLFIPHTWLILCAPSILLIISFTFSIRKLRSKEGEKETLNI